MNLETLIPLITGLVGLAVSTATFLYKFIKAIKEKNLAKIESAYAEFTQKTTKVAETIVGLTGESKLAVALTKFNQLCINAGIVYDEAKAKGYIEQFLALTKIVNARDKDIKNKEVNL